MKDFSRERGRQGGETKQQNNHALHSIGQPIGQGSSLGLGWNVTFVPEAKGEPSFSLCVPLPPAHLKSHYKVLIA